MTKVFAIAWNTFKEAVRNRVLYVLLFFAVLIMFGAWVASTLSIDDHNRIVRNLGVGAINFISLLIAVFVGIGLVYNDLDKKTIYTIVSKPISRWQFLLGKYLGLLLTIAVNVLIMTWVFAVVLHFRASIESEVLRRALFEETAEGFAYKGTAYHIGYYIWSVLQSIVLATWHILSLGYDGYQITSGLFTASVLTIFEMAVITAFAVLFSSFSSPTLSAFMTVIVFIIGRLNMDLYLFAQTMVDRAGGFENLSAGQQVAYYFATGAAHIMPNLSFFDQREAISYFEPVHLTPLESLYGIVYTMMIIYISIIVFNRRNFK